MRRFKCLSNEELATVYWGGDFIPGKVYQESEKPNPCPSDNTLFLDGEDGCTKYVDKAQFEEVPVTVQSEEVSPWKKYRRIGHSEMRPYILGEDLSNISVASEDNPEFDLGVVARNPKNHNDQWYVARDYFNENLEEIVDSN